MSADLRQLMLAFNENPEPVAQPILAGIQAGAELVNRYTFDSEARVLAALARYYDCSPANLALVRGIDEAFDRLSHEFPAMRYATAWPGFDGYIGRIRLHGYRHRELRLTDEFALHPADLERLTADEFVFLADPSNPTGRPLSPDELATIRARAGKVCIDETYVDYAGKSAGRPEFGGDLFVFRSFSKSFGLAGARLGAVFGEADVIAAIKRKQWYCNVGVLELHALEAALAHDGLRARHVERTVAERERIREGLARLGLRVYPSAGNFVLVKNRADRPIDAFLRERRIRVSNTERFGLAGHVRISVGLAADNDRLLAAMSEYAGG